MLPESFTINQITYSDCQIASEGPKRRKHLEAQVSFSVERNGKTHTYHLHYVGSEFSPDTRDSDLWKLLKHEESHLIHREDLLESHVRNLSQTSPPSGALLQAKLDLEALRAGSLFEKTVRFAKRFCV